jgi:NodT family efflux transporter outer membrane factor (OMF) lipoprotein
MIHGRSHSGMLAAGLTLLAAGCAPTPRLAVAPEIYSADWRPRPAQAAVDAAPARSLGAAFGSSALEAVTARAMAANPDLSIAAARIEQARAQLRIAKADSMPAAFASAGLSSARSNANVGASDFKEGSAGLDISYEVDLFGRVKAAKKAARARFDAVQFDRDAVALAVQADVARSFVQLAALARRLELLDRSIDRARELLRIIEVRQRLGEATKVDTGLQAIQLRQLEVQRERLAEARARTLNALSLLAGEEAPSFSAPVDDLAALSVPVVPAVLPAELLVRRPDILAAEARIRGARGDVAQARAAFLPRLRLSLGGFAASGFGGPIETVISAGASLLAPIFDGGRLRGNFDFASAAQVESVELYRKTLLTALRESEDALSGVDRSRAREALLAEIVRQATETARLARLQYVGGDADLRWVLDAESRLAEAEDAHALALQERLEAAIDLYRAFGGATAERPPIGGPDRIGG